MKKQKKHIKIKKNINILSNNFVRLNKINDINLSKFEINEYGQLRNTETKQFLNYNSRYGYLYYGLWITNLKKSIHFSMHKLVAIAFLENPNNFDQVHHKDSNRENNHYSNLEWTNNQTNTIYAIGKKVNQYTLDGEYIRTFRTLHP